MDKARGGRLTASNVLKWYWWRFNGYGYFGDGHRIGASLRRWRSGRDHDILRSTHPIIMPLVVGCFAATLLRRRRHAVLKRYTVAASWGFGYDLASCRNAEFQRTPIGRDSSILSELLQTILVAFPWLCRSSNQRDARPSCGDGVILSPGRQPGKSEAQADERREGAAASMTSLGSDLLISERENPVPARARVAFFRRLELRREVSRGVRWAPPLLHQTSGFDGTARRVDLGRLCRTPEGRAAPQRRRRETLPMREEVRLMRTSGSGYRFSSRGRRPAGGLPASTRLLDSTARGGRAARGGIVPSSRSSRSARASRGRRWPRRSTGRGVRRIADAVDGALGDRGKLIPTRALVCEPHLIIRSPPAPVGTEGQAASGEPYLLLSHGWRAVLRSIARLWVESRSIAPASRLIRAGGTDAAVFEATSNAGSRYGPRGRNGDCGRLCSDAPAKDGTARGGGRSEAIAEPTDSSASTTTPRRRAQRQFPSQDFPTRSSGPQAEWTRWVEVYPDGIPHPCRVTSSTALEALNQRERGGWRKGQVRRPLRDERGGFVRSLRPPARLPRGSSRRLFSMSLMETSKGARLGQRSGSLGGLRTQSRIRRTRALYSRVIDPTRQAD